MNAQRYSLPADLRDAVDAAIADWERRDNTARLWARDASLWTSADESKWLGWLDAADDPVVDVDRVRALAAEAAREEYTHALLLGMGGSSLCPEVLAMTFGRQAGHSELHVLDSTDPAQVLAFERKVDLPRTIFIVSSKSGSTLEPNIFKQYFFERVRQIVGPDRAGRQFIAITDPGSKLQQVAEADGFRAVLPGLPSIGGRYSALSAFGLAPAAIMGIDVAKLLERTREMSAACRSSAARENPGVTLGLVMGVLASLGRDKLTFVCSPGIWDVGAWMEQLIAESTGKMGKGIIPVDLEDVARPSTYASDRLFAYLRHDASATARQDRAVAALIDAGQPVVTIEVEGPETLGQEFFRWEIATAVAGSVLQINPFDQPDVEASKIATRALTDAYEKSGSLPEEHPRLREHGIALFANDANAREIGADRDASLASALGRHLERLTPGDYFALLAYVEMNDTHKEALQRIRHAVRDRYKVATCLGFGPRFLHSTGQLYKGGPNTVVVLQITCDNPRDVPIPGQKYTFGIVKAAQARGDLQVLENRLRRAVRLHLSADVTADLALVERYILG